MRIRPHHLLLAIIGLAPLPLFAADNCDVNQFSAALLQRNNANAAADLQRSAPAFTSLTQLQAKVQKPDQPMAAQLSAADMQQILADGRQIRIATASRALELNQNDEIQALTALLQASEKLKTAADAWLASHGTLDGFSADAALDATGISNLHLLERLMEGWRQTHADTDGDLRAAIGSLSDRPTADTLTRLTGVEADH